MAQQEFLQGEITEQFLATGQPLQEQWEGLAFLPSTIALSILCCPSMLLVCTL